MYIHIQIYVSCWCLHASMATTMSYCGDRSWHCSRPMILKLPLVRSGFPFMFMSCMFFYIHCPHVGYMRIYTSGVWSCVWDVDMSLARSSKQ